MRVFVTGRIPSAAVDTLRADQTLTVDVWDGDGPIPRNELLMRVSGAAGVITLLTERVDDELLTAAGAQLQIVANVAVGYNNFDMLAFTDRQVVATNTPGVLTDATADVALALTLMVTRRLSEGERVIRSGEPWAWGMFYKLGTGIAGKRLGIVGLGAIGQAFARRAQACGMTIAYTQRRRLEASVEASLGATFLSFEELLHTSDVVSLHCPYSPETHHLLNAEALAMMGAHTFLINTARGPIVDETALVQALESRGIAGAGLDVYEHEPVVHPGLVDRDDVVLLPHLGSATVETRTAMAMLAVNNVKAVLSGQPALTPIG